MATQRKVAKDGDGDDSKQMRALRKEQKQAVKEVEQESSNRLQWLLLVAVILLAIIGLYYYYAYYQPPSSSLPSSTSTRKANQGRQEQTGTKPASTKHKKASKNPSQDKPKSGRKTPPSKKVEKSAPSTAGKQPSAGGGGSFKTSSAPYKRNQKEVRIADLRLLRRPIPPSDQDRPYIIEILSADDLLQSGDYNGALEKFNEILGRFRQSPRAAFGKALALEHIAVKKKSNKLMDTAIDFYYDVAFESGLANDDLKLNALIRLASHAQNRGKINLSIKALRKASEMEPTNSDYAVRVGVALANNKQTDKAMEQFETVLKSWPDNSLAHANLGYLLYREKRYDDAVTYLLAGVRGKEQSVRSDPKYYLYAGDSLVRLNRSDEAHQLYKEAVSLKVFPSVWQRPLVREPGLLARPWWTPDLTGYSTVLDTFTKGIDKIKREAEGAIDTKTGMFDSSSEDQSVLVLYASGKRNTHGCQIAPVTCGLVEQFDEAALCTSGESKFVILPPGVHIRPHTGPTNTILTAMIPVHLPAPVHLRIGEEARDVTDKIVVFDGSFEQELRYHGDQPGILLLLDMWHPGLPADKLPSL